MYKPNGFQEVWLSIIYNKKARPLAGVCLAKDFKNAGNLYWFPARQLMTFVPGYSKRLSNAFFLTKNEWS
ncbi:MAG: hypothetical protein IPH12_13760 [Saprospirales bacterium]|nr:hypothetical protein [Saprospirales bacterium]